MGKIYFKRSQGHSGVEIIWRVFLRGYGLKFYEKIKDPGWVKFILRGVKAIVGLKLFGGFLRG